jgi:hypothetical protein
MEENMPPKPPIHRKLIEVSEREWQPMTPTIKALWSDPASKRRAQITRFEPGATLPMHPHAGD